MVASVLLFFRMECLLVSIYFIYPKPCLVINKKETGGVISSRDKMGDGFSLNNNIVICEKHFKSEDINISLGRKRWTLKQDVEPSFFYWSGLKINRKFPRKILSFAATSSQCTRSSSDKQEFVYFCEPLPDKLL